MDGQISYQSSTSNRGTSFLQDAFDKMLSEVVIEGGGGLGSDDYIALDSQITTERTQRISADNTLANSISNEITRAMTKEEQLDGDVQIALNMTLQDTLDNNPSNLDFRGTSQLMYIDTDLAAIDNQVIPKVQIQDMIQIETDARNTQHDTQQELIEEIGDRSLQQIHTINPYEQLDLHQAKLFVDDIESENTDTRRVANIQYADDLYNLLQGQLQQRTLNIIQEQLGLSADLDFSTETSNKILAPDIDMNTHKITLRSLESPAEQIQEMEPVPYYLFAQQIDSVQQRIDDFSTEGQVTLQSIQDAQPDNLNMGSRQILVDNVAEGISPDPRQVVPAEYIDDAIGSLQSQLNNQTLQSIYLYNKITLDMSLDQNRILLRDQLLEGIENIPSDQEAISWGYVAPRLNNIEQLIQTNNETSVSGDQQLQANIDALQDKLNYQPAPVEGETLPPIQKLLATATDLQLFADMDCNYYNIKNLEDPVNANDAVNKQTMENAILIASGDLQGAIDLRALTEDLNNEITDRQDTDAALQTNINLKANQTALQDEIDERTTQDGILLANIQTRALASDLTSEISTRLNNDNQLQSNIDNKRNILDSYSITETNTLIANDFKSKIQNTAIKSKIDCSGDNTIDIYANNVKLGKFYQPVGQATTPFGIQTDDKLQLQSNLSSISCFGAKPVDPSAMVLNTHGVYLTGIDSNVSTANVQSVVSCSTQYGANVYLSAGHIGTTKFAALSSDSGLQISGGLQPTTVDPTITCLPASASSSMPITFTSKAGYSTTTTIDQNNQFVSKKYVDDANATQNTTIATKIDNTTSSLANYTTTTNLNTSLALKADQLTTYTKTEVDDAIAAIPITDLTDYYNKTETDTLLDLKANSSETYTITQTNDLLQDKMNVTSSLASIQAAIPIESNLQLGQFTIETAKTSGFLDQELVTKAYVDNAGSGSQLTLTQIQEQFPSQSDLNMNDIAILSAPLTYGSETLINVDYLESQLNTLSRIPVGAIMIYYSENIPSDWLVCNGSSIPSQYTDLIALIGSNTPDMRGLFVRGRDTRSNGNLDSDGIRSIGNVQLDHNKSHSHTYQDAAFMAGGDSTWSNTTGSGNNDGDNRPLWRTTAKTLTSNGTLASTQIPTSSDGDSEVTVKNICINYIICAKTIAASVPQVGITSSDNLNMNNFQIQNLNAGTLSTDAINLGQLTSAVSTINTSLDSKYSTSVKLNQIAVPNASLSMNANKITDLSEPTSNFDAVNLFYLNSQGYYNSSSSIPKMQFNTTSMQALFPTSTTYQVKFYNNSLPYIEVANGSKSVSFNADLFQLYNNTTGVQNMKITNDGMWFNRAINIRSSLSQGGDAIMYINADGFPQTKDYSFHLVDSSGNGASFDSRCTFNGTIEANSSTYINGLSYFSEPVRTDIIGAPISVGNISGYSIIASGSMSATQYDIYVPISDRRSKSNIQYYENTLDDLMDIKFCKFKYCPQKLQQLGYKDVSNIDCEKTQIGCIVDETPSRYHLQLSSDKFENPTDTYYTVNLSAIRQDCLIYLMQRNKILEARCQNYESRLQALEALLLPQ